MRSPIVTMWALAASLAALFSAAVLAQTAASSVARAGSDVLDRPAQQSPLAAKRLLIAMARAGDDYVAARFIM